MNFIPAIVWMAVIFVGSSIPDLPAPPGGIGDTSVHAAEYALLGALLLRGFAGARWAGVTAVAVLLSIATATVYGALDEVHQAFVPGRESALTDLVADATGAGVVTGALWAWGIIRRFRATDTHG